MEKFELCDVCGRQQALDVIASQPGPVSYNKCQKCQSMHAEPVRLICLEMYFRGGKAQEQEGLESITCFIDGKYEPATAALSFYHEYEKKIDQDKSLKILKGQKL